MSTAAWDTLVIGGGPAGSASAAFLAKAGQKVLILEKQSFPRFHIGESLLPFGNDVLKDLGVWDKIQKAGFMPKLGAEFVMGNSAGSHSFWFRKTLPPPHAQTFQVERSKFDHILFDHAREAGAHAPPESSLEDIRFDQDMVNFSYRHKDQTHQATARWCIDASGRTSVVGRTLNLTKCDLGMPKKIAVFSHFKGVHRNEGEAMGHITIVRIPQGWFWLIPLDETKTSVGLVQMLKSFKSTGLTPQESFTQTVNQNHELVFRMQKAQRLTDFHTEADYTFRHKQAAGPRWLLAGDSAGFIDPIFSSGVMVALRSAQLAAQAVLKADKSGGPIPQAQRTIYTNAFKSMTNVFRDMIGMFYNNKAFEVFMNPNPWLQIPGAVTHMVAGNTVFTWSVFWRVRVFFALCLLQRYLRVAPRLSFSHSSPSRQPALSF